MLLQTNFPVEALPSHVPRIIKEVLPHGSVCVGGGGEGWGGGGVESVSGGKKGGEMGVVVYLFHYSSAV